MAPGQTHVHRIKFTPNRVLLGEEYNNTTANFKGFTIYTMMVVSGTPVDNNASTGYVVSTADAKVDYVTRKSYTYKNNLDFLNKLTATNNLTTLTQANEHTMSVDQAVDITNSNFL